eukprot:5357349-Pleurochrysis_carterae.AAC.1
MRACPGVGAQCGHDAAREDPLRGGRLPGQGGDGICPKARVEQARVAHDASNRRIPCSVQACAVRDARDD